MKYRNYSHIYIEESAKDAELTRELIDRFSHAEIVPIRSYKDVFNRPQQEWQIQKKSQKLILASKPDSFLYPGTKIAPDFGHEHFYYNTLLLNCVYDCSYCYLQGMYQSANLVLFVNESDFLSATQDKLDELGSMYLCISYDTDLLGFESLFGINRRWIEFARHKPELTIESRTKSSNFAAIQDLEPSGNFIFAWTLSPEAIQKQFESNTPSLDKRIKSLCAALDAGWPVRICIDPILHIENWQQIYSDFMIEIANRVPLDKVKDFTLGVFRMNLSFLKNIKKQRRKSSLLYYPYNTKDGIASYPDEVELDMKNHVFMKLQANGVDPNKIAIVGA